NFVRDFLEPDLDVVELGSSLGVVALHILRKQSPHRKLICVEANPYLIETIQENLSRNEQGRHTTVIHAAIDYGASDEVKFNTSEDNLVSLVGGNAGEHHMVRTTSLSSL